MNRQETTNVERVMAFADPVVADRSARFVSQFANPLRLRLLCRLVCEGRRSVSELAALTGESQPSVSRQLKLLHLDRLVDRHRDGPRVYYSVTDPAVVETMEYLAELAPRLERPSGWVAS
jgi:DNA-binding transcriptional ArsR family regulator